MRKSDDGNGQLPKGIEPDKRRESLMATREDTAIAPAPGDLICPECHANTVRCDCTLNAACTECTYRYVTFPCKCRNGVPAWENDDH